MGSEARSDGRSVGAGSNRAHRWQASVLEALRACSAPISAQTLHAILQREGRRIGLSTVYRELHRMVDAGQVQEGRVGHESVYRVSDRDLLVCDLCGRTRELPRLIGSTVLLDGFFGARAPVTVHGRCAECSPGARG